MPRKQNLKLSIPLPEGVSPSKELETQAIAAVKTVLAELEEVAAKAKELEAQGYEISVNDLLQRKKTSISSTPKVAKTKTTASKSAKKTATKPQGKGKRVVLTDAQKKKVVELLKEGKKAREIATKYGVSTATVNNLKRDAGLTKPSAAQEKLFAERKKSTAKKSASA